MSSLSFVRTGFHTITPTLLVDDPEGLIQFLRQAFAAEEVARTLEEGAVRHAVLRLGDSIVEVEPAGRWAARPAALHLYVKDARSTYQRALESGAKMLYA